MIVDYSTIASVAALLLTVFFLTMTLLTIDFGHVSHNVITLLIDYYLFFSLINVTVFGLTIIFSVINSFISFILLIISIIVLGISLYAIFYSTITFIKINSEVENVINAKIDRKQ